MGLVGWSLDGGRVMADSWRWLKLVCATHHTKYLAFDI